MQTQPIYYYQLPLLTKEFDLFVLNNDLGATLRDVEPASFYHDALDTEE